MIRVDVNGETQEADVAPRTWLVHWLREDLAPTGTHIGCEASLCGACSVHVDDRAVKSCTMFAVQADGKSVRTLETVGEADALHPLQTGFWEEHGLQCGCCTPGMIMSAAQLLAENPSPSDEQIRHTIEHAKE
jgi:carbon-monoxide dehydrogenase small subunit